MKNAQMTLWQVVSLGIGSIVGAGIFALLGQVLQETGNWTYLSFIISGCIAMLAGYAYIKLAAAFPSAGGITDYFRHAFKHPWIGTTLSLIYVFTTLISAGTMAKSFGIYIVGFLPHSGLTSVNVLAASLLILLGLFNMMKTHDVGWTEAFLVTFKIGILALLILAGFYHFKGYNPSFTIQTDTGTFFRSIGLTFFAFAGFGVITNASAYVKNPAKTIKTAMFLTLLIVMLLYIGLAFVIMNYIPAEAFRQDINIAVTVVAKQLLGEIGRFLIYAAAVMAFITGISASYFSVFRITRALSEHQALPDFYHKKLIGHGTYGNALTVLALTLFTVLFGFDDIVNLSSVAYLISYMGVFTAAWVLRKRTYAHFLPLACGFLAMTILLLGFIWSVYL